MTAVINSRSGVPEINGSSAAFLALVITLAVFVLLCCITIWWLLKYHQPTDIERARRKAELQAERSRELHSSSDPRSLTARIARMFGRDGWVHASDVEDDQVGNQNFYRSKPSVDTPRGSGPDSASNNSNHRFSQSSSTSTVQFSTADFPHSSPDTIAGPMYAQYVERSRNVSPEPSILTTTSSLGFEEHMNPHEHDYPMSAEVFRHDDHYSLDGDHQEFSVQSPDPTVEGIPMRKWDNGTKFKEVISY